MVSSRNSQHTRCTHHASGKLHLVTANTHDAHTHLVTANTQDAHTHLVTANAHDAHIWRVESRNQDVLR